MSNLGSTKKSISPDRKFEKHFTDEETDPVLKNWRDKSFSELANEIFPKIPPLPKTKDRTAKPEAPKAPKNPLDNWIFCFEEEPKPTKPETKAKKRLAKPKPSTTPSAKDTATTPPSINTKEKSIPERETSKSTKPPASSTSKKRPNTDSKAKSQTPLATPEAPKAPTPPSAKDSKTKPSSIPTKKKSISERETSKSTKLPTSSITQKRPNTDSKPKSQTPLATPETPKAPTTRLAKDSKTKPSSIPTKEKSISERKANKPKPKSPPKKKKKKAVKSTTPPKPRATPKEPRGKGMTNKKALAARKRERRRRAKELRRLKAQEAAKLEAKKALKIREFEAKKESKIKKKDGLEVGLNQQWLNFLTRHFDEEKKTFSKNSRLEIVELLHKTNKLLSRDSDCPTEILIDVVVSALLYTEMTKRVNPDLNDMLQKFRLKLVILLINKIPQSELLKAYQKFHEHKIDDGILLIFYQRLIDAKEINFNDALHFINYWIIDIEDKELNKISTKINKYFDDRSVKNAHEVLRSIIKCKKISESDDLKNLYLIASKGLTDFIASGGFTSKTKADSAAKDLDDVITKTFAEVYQTPKDEQAELVQKIVKSLTKKYDNFPYVIIEGAVKALNMLSSASYPLDPKILRPIYQVFIKYNDSLEMDDLDKITQASAKALSNLYKKFSITPDKRFAKAINNIDKTEEKIYFAHLLATSTNTKLFMPKEMAGFFHSFALKTIMKHAKGDLRMTSPFSYARPYTHEYVVALEEKGELPLFDKETLDESYDALESVMIFNLGQDLFSLTGNTSMDREADLTDLGKVLNTKATSIAKSQRAKTAMIAMMAITTFCLQEKKDINELNKSILTRINDISSQCLQLYISALAHYAKTIPEYSIDYKRIIISIELAISKRIDKDNLSIDTFNEISLYLFDPKLLKAPLAHLNSKPDLSPKDITSLTHNISFLIHDLWDIHKFLDTAKADTKKPSFSLDFLENPKAPYAKRNKVILQNILDFARNLGEKSLNLSTIGTMLIDLTHIIDKNPLVLNSLLNDKTAKMKRVLKEIAAIAFKNGREGEQLIATIKKYTLNPGYNHLLRQQGQGHFDILEKTFERLAQSIDRPDVFSKNPRLFNTALYYFFETLRNAKVLLPGRKAVYRKVYNHLFQALESGDPKQKIYGKDTPKDILYQLKFYLSEDMLSAKKPSSLEVMKEYNKLNEKVTRLLGAARRELLPS